MKERLKMVFGGDDVFSIGTGLERAGFAGSIRCL